jgi:hypothetical protein
MTKLSDAEKAERAEARRKIRAQKFTSKRWTDKLVPEFAEQIMTMHIMLGAPDWRASAPPHILKLRPMIDKIHKALQPATGSKRPARAR